MPIKIPPTWKKLNEQKPKTGQLVCMYWPPNLEDGSRTETVVWGGHNRVNLFPSTATHWIELPQKEW